MARPILLPRLRKSRPILTERIAIAKTLPTTNPSRTTRRPPCRTRCRRRCGAPGRPQSLEPLTKDQARIALLEIENLEQANRLDERWSGN